jgi:hypothetical protein
VRIVAVCVVALACAPLAAAHRAPTPSERAAIETAVRYFPPISRGNKLAFRTERVSTVDARYARADAFVRDAKRRPIGLVTTLLRRSGESWRVIFFGTDPPGCAVVSVRVRVDLLGSRTCLRR